MPDLAILMPAQLIFKFPSTGDRHLYPISCRMDICTVVVLCIWTLHFSGLVSDH